MGTPLYMELADACVLVTEYAEMHTGGDVLAGLKEMRASWDDFDKEDTVAYTMCMDARRKMFAPKEQ